MVVAARGEAEAGDSSSLEEVTAFHQELRVWRLLAVSRGYPK
jgi:hypothetical protein